MPMYRRKDLTELCEAAGLSKCAGSHRVHAVFEINKCGKSDDGTFAEVELSVSKYAWDDDVHVEVLLCGGRLGARYTSDGPIENDDYVFSEQFSAGRIKELLPDSLKRAREVYDREADLIR